MICPVCNTENREGAKFCDECGHRFTTAFGKVGASSTDSQPGNTLAGLPKITLDDPSDLPEPPEAEDAESPLAAEAAPTSADGAAPDVSPDEGAGAPASDFGEGSSDEAGDDGEEVPQADLSGFVFEGSEPGDLDVAQYSDLETAQIPLSAVWGSGHTEEMPRVGAQAAAGESMSVSAPADKKQERALKREMKKKEREQRRQLKSSGRAARRGIAVAVAIVAVVAVVAVAVGYGFELWGGKTVPDVLGKTEADARYELERSGFSVRVDQVRSDDTEGLVQLSDPTSGSRVADGSEIVITVSVSRTVPAVVGTTSDSAVALIRDAGYNEQNITVEQEKTNESADGTVLSVTPAEGEKAKSNAKITLKVASNYRVPDVTKMTQDNAVATLVDAGYQVYVNEVETTLVSEGSIYSVEPSANTVLDPGEFVTVYIATQRSAKLTAAATSYLSSIGSLTYGDVSLYVTGVSSVTYLGNGTVSFTVAATPTTTLNGISMSGTATTASGTIAFDDSNQVSSVQVTNVG